MSEARLQAESVGAPGVDPVRVPGGLRNAVVGVCGAGNASVVLDDRENSGVVRVPVAAQNLVSGTDIQRIFRCPIEQRARSIAGL